MHESCQCVQQRVARCRQDRHSSVGAPSPRDRPGRHRPSPRGDEMHALVRRHLPAVDRLRRRPHPAESYRQWQAAEQTAIGTYQDVHCWVFTPASLELILGDLQFIGLSWQKLRPRKIRNSEPPGRPTAARLGAVGEACSQRPGFFPASIPARRQAGPAPAGCQRWPRLR